MQKSTVFIIFKDKLLKTKETTHFPKKEVTIDVPITGTTERIPAHYVA